MIGSKELEFILSRAYVPEHSPDLIGLVSGGEPFLFEDYFCCRADHGIIVIGYPLEREFDLHEFDAVLRKIIKKLNPAGLSLIAPRIPPSFQNAVVEHETDQYYTLDLVSNAVPGYVKRIIDKAGRLGAVQSSNELTEAHHELAVEFIDRANPPARVRELMFRMWNYVGRSKYAAVMNVWHNNGKLAAFFVVDFAPKHFASYIIGCHSKLNYIPGASDLLMSELIKTGIDRNKRFIHLGIGVNSGIRSFKQKWGGLPTIPYELCEFVLERRSLADALMGGIG